jgi:hypothetical protein
MGVGGQHHTPAALTPAERAPVPTMQEAACAPGPVWTGVEEEEKPPINPQNYQLNANSDARQHVHANYRHWLLSDKTVYVYCVLSCLRSKPLLLVKRSYKGVKKKNKRNTCSNMNTL